MWLPVKEKLTYSFALSLTAEVNNLIGNRVKKPRMEGRGYVVPDSILVGARDRNALESSLDAEQMSVSAPRPCFSFYH